MSNVKITSIRSCKKNKYKYIFELGLPSSCNEKKIDYLKYSNQIVKKTVLFTYLRNNFNFSSSEFNFIYLSTPTVDLLPHLAWHIYHLRTKDNRRRATIPYPSHQRLQRALVTVNLRCANCTRKTADKRSVGCCTVEPRVVATARDRKAQTIVPHFVAHQRVDGVAHCQRSKCYALSSFAFALSCHSILPLDVCVCAIGHCHRH